MPAKAGYNVLFLCAGNSCRSQMAEGFARSLYPDRLNPYSAGVEPKPLDPRAVAVMREAGVDISGQRPKRVSELPGIRFDCVVSVCDRAREACPAPASGLKPLHLSFEDPPALAAGAATEEEALGHYRRVRDEIKAFVESLAQMAPAPAPEPAPQPPQPARERSAFRAWIARLVSSLSPRG